MTTFLCNRDYQFTILNFNIVVVIVFIVMHIVYRPMQEHSLHTIVTLK